MLFALFHSYVKNFGHDSIMNMMQGSNEEKEQLVNDLLQLSKDAYEKIVILRLFKYAFRAIFKTEFDRWSVAAIVGIVVSVFKITGNVARLYRMYRSLADIFNKLEEGYVW